MVARKSPAPKAAEPPVIAQFESEDDDPIEDGPNVIENIVKGSELHLGDGRKLAFGEKAEVSPDLAAFLRERGQAR
jgi:hypothetical protein